MNWPLVKKVAAAISGGYCDLLSEELGLQPFEGAVIFHTGFTKACVKLGIPKRDLEAFIKKVKAEGSLEEREELEDLLEKVKPRYIQYRGFYLLVRKVVFPYDFSWSYEESQVLQIKVHRHTGKVVHGEYELLHSGVYQNAESMPTIVDKIILKEGLSNKRWAAVRLKKRASLTKLCR